MCAAHEIHAFIPRLSMSIYLLLTSVQHYLKFQMSGRALGIGMMGREEVMDRRRNRNKCLNRSCDIEHFTSSHQKCCMFTPLSQMQSYY